MAFQPGGGRVRQSKGSLRSMSRQSRGSSWATRRQCEHASPAPRRMSDCRSRPRTMHRTSRDSDAQSLQSPGEGSRRRRDDGRGARIHSTVRSSFHTVRCSLYMPAKFFPSPHNSIRPRFLSHRNLFWLLISLQSPSTCLKYTTPSK
jgi:hypothetical protein